MPLIRGTPPHCAYSTILLLPEINLLTINQIFCTYSVISDPDFVNSTVGQWVLFSVASG